jgi:hypothetical protein
VQRRQAALGQLISDFGGKIAGEDAKRALTNRFNAAVVALVRHRYPDFDEGSGTS